MEVPSEFKPFTKLHVTDYNFKMSNNAGSL